MLVAMRPPENCLALAEMMDAVDQSQFLKLFHSTIDSDQANTRHHSSRLIKDLHGGDRPAAGSNDIKDHPARAGDPAAAQAELAFPGISSFRIKFIHSY